MKSGKRFISLCQVFDNKLTLRFTHEKQRGAMLPVAVLGLFAFLAVGSLAIDISHQMTAGVELQNAADASARAGVTALNGTQGGITEAVNRALSTTNTYDWGTPITVSRADVRFAANVTEFNNGGQGQDEATAKTHAAAIRFIKVKIPLHHIRGVFTKVAIGKTMLSVTRESIASRTPNGVVAPSPDAPEGTPPVLTGDSVLNTVCSWVPLSALQDPANFMPLNVTTPCGDPYKFTPGCTYVIRAGSNGNGTGFVAGGNFQALAPIYPNGTVDRGGSDLRTNIAGGVKFCIHPGDWTATEPGVNAGTVRQGLNSRFGDYQAGLSATTYPPDRNVRENITYAQYTAATPGSANFQAPSTGTGQANRRVIIIPIINNNEFNNGRDRVRIYDLGAFFLRSRVSNGSGDVTAEYIGGAYYTTSAHYDPNHVPVSPSNGGKVRVISRAALVR